MITLGLSEILVGPAAPDGNMPKPDQLKKIGKTYKDTAKLGQDKSEVTEHYEEGRAAPEVRKKTKKIPVFTFSIMNADIDMLVAYVGGTKEEKKEGGKSKWTFDGSENVANCSFLIKSDQGLWFEVPNGDIDAVINSEMSAKGIFLVDFVVTPLAVSEGKAIRAYDPDEK